MCTQNSTKNTFARTNFCYQADPSNLVLKSKLFLQNKFLRCLPLSSRVLNINLRSILPCFRKQKFLFLYQICVPKKYIKKIEKQFERSLPRDNLHIPRL